MRESLFETLVGLAVVLVAGFFKIIVVDSLRSVRPLLKVGFCFLRNSF